MLRKLHIALGLAVLCVGIAALYLEQHLAHATARASTAAPPAAGADAQRVLSATRDPSAPLPASASRDPRVARDRIRGQLVQSGAASPSRAGDGGSVIRNISALQPTALVIGPADCWAAGCTARVTVRAGAEFSKSQRELSHALKHQWKGGVVVTGPEDQPDGATQCSLFLLNDAHP